MTSKEAWASVMYQSKRLWENVRSQRNTYWPTRPLPRCIVRQMLDRLHAQPGQAEVRGHVLKRPRIFSDVKMLRNKLESRAEMVSCMLLIVVLLVEERVVGLKKGRQMRKAESIYRQPYTMMRRTAFGFRSSVFGWSIPAGGSAGWRCSVFGISSTPPLLGSPAASPTPRTPLSHYIVVQHPCGPSSPHSRSHSHTGQDDRYHFAR
jgi:hypothetical protein